MVYVDKTVANKIPSIPQLCTRIIDKPKFVIPSQKENRTKVGMKIKRNDPDLYNYFQLMTGFHMCAAIIAVSL